MSALQRLRCTVYTRKSSEEGLDQEFNSLDAQREACSAFIASQVGLGWKLVPDRYDDGGISGGTMERPALKRLLADIAAKRVDVVVVYKIDRLTRSLTDFAKIVDVFDGNTVSFVSVTQQFNTTTSMGRLTLNVLLSFAQFEREVTAERIRDKIAASKKKGMWMGGTVPIGYQVCDRKLLIKEAEASFVRGLFRRYLELKSVPALAAEVTRQASKSHKVDGPDDGSPSAYTRRVGSGMLYKLLSNPLYIGKLKHRENVYDGEHQAIVDTALFDEVQSLLTKQAATPRGASAHRDVHLLTALLFDDTGDRMRPVHATTRGKRYRYYISSRMKAGEVADSTAWRIPATAIDEQMRRWIIRLLGDRSQLVDWLTVHAPRADLNRSLVSAARLRDRFRNDTAADQRRLLADLVEKITLGREVLTLVINAAKLVSTLTGGPSADDVSSARDPNGLDDHHGVVSIELPVTIKRRGNELRLVIQGDSLPPAADPKLVSLVARAHLYLQHLTRNPDASITEVATAFGVHRADVGRILPLAFLAPKIVEQILTGRQPETMSALKLSRNDLPYLWADQPAALSC